MPPHNSSTTYSNQFNILQIVDPTACLSPKDLIAQAAMPQRCKVVSSCPPQPSNLVVDDKMHRRADQCYDSQRQRNTPRDHRIMNPKFKATQGRSHEGSSNYHAGAKSPPKYTPPPRFQNTLPQSKLEPQGFCNSTPRPLVGFIAPCGPKDTSSEQDLLNAQLKQSVFLELQKKPSNANANTQPMPRPTPPSIPSKDCVPDPTPPLCRPPTMQQDNNITVISTPTEQTVKSLPISSAQDVLSRPPTDPSLLIDSFEKLNVNLPPSPPKPAARRNFRHSRKPPSKKPQSSETPRKQETDDSGFELHNAPAIPSRIVSPPPSEVSPSSVKLPSRKEAHPVPPSPSTTGSSLASEDLSGSSFVVSSDTTFTSMESNDSWKPRPSFNRRNETCKNWTNGYRCFLTPCPFLHGEKPQERTRFAPRAPQRSSPPQPFPNTTKTSASSATAPPSFQKSVSAPRNHNTLSRDTEPSHRPEALYATTISDHIKVKFDQGFEVRDVMTGFESRWVHLGNIAGSVTHHGLKKLLAPYQVDTLNVPEQSEKPVTVKVQFVSAAEAMKAVTGLHGSEFAHRNISAKLAINNSSKGNTVITDTDVQVTWECPQRVGYAGYATLKEAKTVIDTVNGFPMDYSIVSASLYDGLPAVGAYNVMFKQLPANAGEPDLRKFGDAESIMLGRANYPSLDNATRFIRSKLEECGTIATFDILPPPFKDGMVKAWVRFTSPAEARAAQEYLDDRRPTSIGLTTLSCRHVVSMSHVLTYSSYKKMRQDLGWLRLSWQRRFGQTVSITERGNTRGLDDSPVYIRLSSERARLLSTLKYEFEQLLSGETVTLDKKPAWDDFFTGRAGLAFIAQLHRYYYGIQIQVQGTRRVISLWGPMDVRHRARQDIIRKVMELKSQQFWHIPLTGKVLGRFLSASLTTLQETLGPENCFLDNQKRTLVVRGNESAFRVACQAVQTAQSRQGDEACTSDVICPVCFNEAVVPMSLECGHKWCRTCLAGYLTSAVDTKMFPLRCLGDEATCTRSIPLSLARKLLPAGDFNAVVEAAFWSYAHNRPEEFHHCPTPNCTQVYRSAPANAVLQCPSCLVRICPACHIESHDGLTCDERDVAEDGLFKEWTSNHDVKSCPGCKVPIERSEGCNHMTCIRCQTHICWECLATFPNGAGIYDHMRTKHGGIGL